MGDPRKPVLNPELEVLKEMGLEEVRELDRKLIELIETNMLDNAENKKTSAKYRNIAIGVALTIGALWTVLIYQLNTTMADMKDTIRQQIVTETDVKHLAKELDNLREDLKDFKNRGY